VLESRRPHLPRELKAYSESALRLKKLKKLVFQLSDGEQKEFQKIMSSKNGMYPGITTLKINLQGGSFPDYERFEPLARQEDSFDADKPSEFDSMNPLQHKLYSMILKNVIRDDDDVVENPEDDDEEDNEDDQEEEEEEERRYNRYDDGDDDSDSDNEDGNGNDNNLLALLPFLLNGNFNEWCMREAIKPFYRFELFPDLKNLCLRQDDQHFPLDSFIIDAFAALKNLEYLDITIHSRPKGSYNLFKGFLELPLIKKFSLGLPFIKNDDWSLLQQFVKNQKNLESLSLSIWNQTHSKARYLQQNVYFEELIKCLENKPLLKSLELRSEYWSLEALSKGLSHLTLVSQLKSLKFEGSDDTMTSDQKPWKRVEGLVNFIKNQKDSLERLGVFLPLANEDSIVTHIAEAISKLNQLKELQFSVNSSVYRGTTTFGRYSEDVFQRSTETKNKPKISEPWNPNVGEYFRKLENLEELWFRFDILEKNPPTWFADIMTALPSLEKLRDIRIMTHSERKFVTEEDRIISAIEQLVNIKKIDYTSFDYSNEGQLEQVVKKVNERQSLRCDLMF